MNFNFSLNETFPGPHNILKIGHDLLPENCHSFTGRNFHILQQRVNDILDTMGDASARYGILLKFIYSEKTRKFCKISTNYLTGST